ncbi:hypothetical protein Plim_2791 [Planctopirus limnophila DSM 3776]|uniref:Uncharacterized protein n=1 Tax=Planctopirus limnophila (strain ATCC 43296 / DSM 3776 / IFAM 1008 / Mu 290) TaxID=521674 RepID=D5SRC1_PLAL2|nr:hypothetical protein [Planctopirus limnophila]ADG68614.1 hypothetical protein Plim_2791 [Planctopirus limnophila DSM 3776]
MNREFFAQILRGVTLAVCILSIMQLLLFDGALLANLIGGSRDDGFVFVALKVVIAKAILIIPSMVILSLLYLLAMILEVSHALRYVKTVIVVIAIAQLLILGMVLSSFLMSRAGTGTFVAVSVDSSGAV